MPIDYSKYHPEWFDKIRPAILKRENYECKTCHRKHKAYYYKTDPVTAPELDEWSIQRAKALGEKIIRIILTIAHLDHNVKNNDEKNLAALCQKCHLNYDMKDNLH
jgi:hypothetical protein